MLLIPTNIQLAHVQEAPNGMEPSSSPGLTSRENRDYQRATVPTIAGIIQHRRISPPDPHVLAGLAQRWTGVLSRFIECDRWSFEKMEAEDGLRTNT
jgi:hypothetical protein